MNSSVFRYPIDSKRRKIECKVRVSTSEQRHKHEKGKGELRSAIYFAIFPDSTVSTHAGAGGKKTHPNADAAVSRRCGAFVWVVPDKIRSNFVGRARPAFEFGANLKRPCPPCIRIWCKFETSMQDHDG
jgi:hypothetical protein